MHRWRYLTNPSPMVTLSNGCIYVVNTWLNKTVACEKEQLTSLSWSVSWEAPQTTTMLTSLSGQVFLWPVLLPSDPLRQLLRWGIMNNMAKRYENVEHNKLQNPGHVLFVSKSDESFLYLHKNLVLKNILFKPRRAGLGCASITAFKTRDTLLPSSG